MQIVRQLVNRSANMAGRRFYKAPAHRQSTMNDLPVPQGDFFELEAARNRRYNAILGTGIAMFCVSFGLMMNTDLIEFHYSPPKSLD